MGCFSSPLIPREGYSKFSRRVHDKFLRSRIPVNAGIEVTRKCNLHCIHCYENGVSGNGREELTALKLYDILDQIAELGSLWLMLTGGEVFAREDFLDVYIYAKKKGFIISVLTNGTLITSEIADTFRKWKPFTVEIPLYGADAATHEKVTQVEGSFNAVLAGIELLKRKNVQLNLKTFVTKANYAGLKQLYKFAEYLGCELSLDCAMFPCIDRSQEPYKYRLEPEEIFEVLFDTLKNKQGYLRTVKESIKNFSCNEESDYLYNCYAGKGIFFIDAFGYLDICIFSKTLHYDLLKGTVKEAAEKYFPLIWKKKLGSDSRCRPCSMRNFCNYCPAIADLEGDKLNLDYYCQTANFLKDLAEKVV
ncbi:MAG: radical SAM protein [Candidatus Omnitrophica bacterium]|nr:radical SAM protein [Candidatus Omnitrophota bacterium]